MANVFEIIASLGGDPIEITTYPPIVNQDLSNFYIDASINQEVPFGWNHSGLSNANSSPNFINNNSFLNSEWFRGSYNDGGLDTKSSFSTPISWTPRMGSVANSGTVQGGTTMLETSTSNGYPYHNDGSRCSPALTLIVDNASNSLRDVEENFLYTPSGSNDPLDDDYTYSVGQASSYGNYKSMNMFGDVSMKAASIISGNGVRILNNDSMSWQFLYGFDQQVDVNSYFRDSVMHSGKYGNPDRFVYSPSIFKLENIFNSTSIGDRVTFELDINAWATKPQLISNSTPFNSNSFNVVGASWSSPDYWDFNGEEPVLDNVSILSLVGGDRMKIEPNIGLPFGASVGSAVTLTARTSYTICVNIFSSAYGGSVSVVSNGQTLGEGDFNSFSNQKVIIDFDTEDETVVSISINIPYSPAAWAQISSVRLEEVGLNVKEAFNDTSPLNTLSELDLIATTSQLQSGVIEAHHYDAGGLSIETYSDPDITTPESTDDVLIFRKWVNPSIGLNEAATTRFRLKDIQQKDSEGFYINTPTNVIATIDVESPDLYLFSNSFEMNKFTSSIILVSRVKIHTCEEAYVTRAASGDDAIEMYYKPSATRTPAPMIDQTIPPSWIGQSLTVDIVVDSLDPADGEVIKDNLYFDFGGSNKYAIPSAGSYQFNLTADHNTPRLRPAMSVDTSNTLYGFKSVISDVQVSLPSPSFSINSEKYGDETDASFNYDAGIRVYATEAGVAQVSMSPSWVEMSGITDSESIKLTLVIDSISNGNEVVLSEKLSGTLVHSTFTTAGIHEIEYNNPVPTSNTLKIAINNMGSGDTLDVKLSSLKLEAVHVEGGSDVIKMDLYESMDFPVTLAVKDFNHLNSNNSSYTKTIKVPATVNNKNVFGSASNIQSLKVDKYTNGVNCEVFRGGSSVFKGLAFLESVDIDEYGDNELNVIFRGGNGSWVEKIKDLPLKEVSSQYYVYDAEQFLDDSELAETEVVFPLCDVGKWGKADWEVGGGAGSGNSEVYFVGIHQLRPSYKIKNVFDSIFKSAGYSIKSEFLNGNSDWGSDFGLDFSNDWSKLIGVCPKPKVSKQDIINSTIELKYTGGDEPSKPAYITQRPVMKSSEPTVGWSSSDADGISHGKSVSWATIDFNQVVSDIGEQHVADVELHGDSTIGISNQQSMYESNTSKISVNRNGYYKITTQANLTLKPTWGYPDEVWDTLPSGSKITDTFTGALIPFFGDDDSWFTQAGLSDLLFSRPSTSKDFQYALNGEETAETLNTEVIMYLSSNKLYTFNILGGTSEHPFYARDSWSVSDVEVTIALHEDVAPLVNYAEYYTDTIAIPRVSYKELLPDSTQLDFISDISKMFNLHWQTNSITREITVEPYNSFYDFDGEVFEYSNWDDIASVVRVVNNSILKKEINYRYKEDSSDESLNGGLSSTSVMFGDKRVLTGSTNYDGESENYELSLFSTCKMAKDGLLAFKNEETPVKRAYLNIPQIHGDRSKLVFQYNSDKPEVNSSHNHKILYYNGKKSVRFSNDSEAAIIYAMSETEGGIPIPNYEGTKPYWSEEYVYAYSYDNSMPENNLSFENTGSVRGLYNKHHQSLVEMLKVSDKIIIADVYLKPNDINNFNFRQLVSIEGNLYIVSKIKDYKPNGDGITEVELVLVTPRGTKEKID